VIVSVAAIAQDGTVSLAASAWNIHLPALNTAI
jgi:hypothetical protein